MSFYRKIACLLVLLCFASAAAQDAACGPFVQQAMSTAEQGCMATGRNQACYGYFALQATPREGVQNFTFSQQGDIVNVADLNSLQLSALDTTRNTWGIALMKLQANLPDTLPGQNVTFLLFGNVEIRNGVPAEGNAAVLSEASAPESDALQPMQAFYFSTGVGGTTCAGAPADGIVIQTPEGAGQIKLRANNVEIELGSTAYLQALPGASMNIRVVAGQSRISSGGKTVIVPAGAEVEIPIDEDLIAIDEPSDPEAYEEFEVDDLPIELLPDEIEIAPPADDETIEEALEEIEYDESYWEDEEYDEGEDEEYDEDEEYVEDEEYEETYEDDESGDLPGDYEGE